MSELKRPKHRISIDETMDSSIEDCWRHIAYDPKGDRIVLLTNPYRCLDTRADWFDFQDGRTEKRVLNNSRRIRVSKTKDWVYLCEK